MTRRQEDEEPIECSQKPLSKVDENRLIRIGLRCLNAENSNITPLLTGVYFVIATSGDLTDPKLASARNNAIQSIIRLRDEWPEPSSADRDTVRRMIRKGTEDVPGTAFASGKKEAEGGPDTAASNVIQLPEQWRKFGS